MKTKNHIKELFDRINGGDDVDAAAEAQEILYALVDLLEECLESLGDPEDYELVDNIKQALAKAQGKE